MLIELDDAELDSRAFNAEIDAALAANWSGESYVSGLPAIQGVLQNSMQRDLPLLTGLAALLIVLFLYLNFRTVQGAVFTACDGVDWTGVVTRCAGLSRNRHDHAECDCACGDYGGGQFVFAAFAWAILL